MSLEALQLKSDIIIPKAKLSTIISVIYENDEHIVIELTDVNGNTLTYKKITYYANNALEV